MVIQFNSLASRGGASKGIHRFILELYARVEQHDEKTVMGLVYVLFFLIRYTEDTEVLDQCG